jgi:hypothetical protein
LPHWVKLFAHLKRQTRPSTGGFSFAIFPSEISDRHHLWMIEPSTTMNQFLRICRAVETKSGRATFRRMTILLVDSLPSGPSSSIMLTHRRSKTVQPAYATGISDDGGKLKEKL